MTNYFKFIQFCTTEQVPVAEVQAAGASPDHRGAAEKSFEPGNYPEPRPRGHVAQQALQRGGVSGGVSPALEQGEFGGKQARQRRLAQRFGLIFF